MFICVYPHQSAGKLWVGGWIENPVSRIECRSGGRLTIHDRNGSEAGDLSCDAGAGHGLDHGVS